ncbi:MAG TPA: ABC transporter permease subunit [Levilinea sp.]|nr:ABC transporter permease subunit [Levilinea sp.]
MIADIKTIIWKEMKEVLIQRGGSRGGFFGILIILGLMGVILPLQTGSEWLRNPFLLLIWSWLPIFLVINIVADAFAGERERHTLETLLASRLSDRAIMLGKISAAVLYAWGMAVSGMLLGAVTVNLANLGSGLQFYSGYAFPAGVVLSLLASVLVASLGVMVSLHAPTARAAYQRLSAIMIVIWLVPTIVLQFLPGELSAEIFGVLGAVNIGAVLAWGAAVLLVADMILIYIGLARFRRARLLSHTV